MRCKPFACPARIAQGADWGVTVHRFDLGLGETMRRKFLLILLLFASTASAQKVEIGGLGGYGRFGADDVSMRSYWVAGVEACGFCARRAAIYFEYSHYGSSAEASEIRILDVDLVSIGLRVQSSPRGVRPFFDIGLSAGQDRFRRRQGTTGEHSIAGLGIGGGASIALGERFYIRPTVRAHIMQGMHVGVAVAAAAGVRF